MASIPTIYMCSGTCLVLVNEVDRPLWEAKGFYSGIDAADARAKAKVGAQGAEAVEPARARRQRR